MSNVGASLLVTWILGELCFLGLFLNDARRVYNNFVPGAFQTASIFRLGSNLGWRFRFSRIDPSLLNETGRLYREGAVRHERLELVWRVGGFILVVCYFSFVQLS